MQRRGPAAMALVMILVVSAFGLAAVSARAAPAVAPSSHPLATDYVYPTDQYGDYVTDFYTGYAYGEVFFFASDPSDLTATIAIHDHNATRDHVADPAFTYVANFSASIYNASADYNVGYLLPFNLSIGGWWNITISGTTGGFGSFDFYVHTYSADISTDRSAYLPGQSVAAQYEVYSQVNYAPHAGTSVTVTGDYLTTDFTYFPLPQSPWTEGSAAIGTFNFSVPLNASTNGYLFLTIYANVTSANYSESSTTDVGLGNLSAPTLRLAQCPGCGSTSTFTDGAVAALSIQEWIASPYGYVTAANMAVHVNFSVNGVAVTPAGAPTDLVTNGTGQAALVFIASSSVFSTTMPNEVWVTVTDPTDPGLANETAALFFTISTVATVTPVLQLSLDSVQYYGGDTVTASWVLSAANASLIQGWTIDQWWAYSYSDDQQVGWGILNTTSPTGHFSFMIPTNFGGTIIAYMMAYNATDSIESNDPEAVVTAPVILLNPNEAYYLPGDTVTIAVTPEGSVFSTATIYGSVIDNSGGYIWSGIVTGNTISVAIPASGAPSWIRAAVVAQSASAGVIASNAVYVDEGSGYAVLAGVATKSSYADGSFQPGQKIDISYVMKAIGTATLPKVFEIDVYPGSAGFYGSGYGTITVEATSPSGTVSYTIPGDTPAGAQTFTVVVYSGTCIGLCEAVTTFSVNVEPTPSALTYELGAGSGITVGWLVLLILLVLVVILGWVWMRRGRMGGGRTPPSAVKPYSAAPSGAAGSTGGGTSWNGSGGSPPASGGSPPPMPSPGGKS